MAAPNLKIFYIALIFVAAIGAGAIVYARGAGRPEARTVSPLPAGADTATAVGYVMGSATAPVEVEEFADFECPACQQFAVLTLPDVRDRLVQTGQVRWRFRDFPLKQHTKTLFAHEAAACAGEQGKFWEMHDQLYFNQNKWVDAGNSARVIREYARTVGLDMGKYDDCYQSQRYQGQIMANFKLGDSRGVNSTPTLVIGSMLIPGSLTYDSVKTLIKHAAAGKATKS